VMPLTAVKALNCFVRSRATTGIRSGSDIRTWIVAAR
jgi:hypothetical protein